MPIIGTCELLVNCVCINLKSSSLMDNRVYYGQYSLSHWLDLILKQNIILPDYQRFFVWNELKVKTLVDTLKKKQFVPPITIGAFKDGAANVNYILDGQQRLTSILLAYLGLYPDQQFFRSTLERLANENDDDVDDGEEQMDDILEWDFRKLTERGKNREEIRSKLIRNNYREVDFGINEGFLKKTFLGFSYLVPQSGDPQVQQRYYSSVFRNINIQGQELLPQESRASLYFLKKDLKNFFAPAFIKDYTVKNANAVTKTDFVRLLALLFQYAKEGGSDKIAKGYKPRMEKYYEEFIYTMVGEIVSPMFKELRGVFRDENYAPRYDLLKQTTAALELPKQANSIIDMDMYFFGLIYIILFRRREINVARRDELKAALDARIRVFKLDPNHRKAPAALKYLKERMNFSIAIYQGYINGQA